MRSKQGGVGLALRTDMVLKSVVTRSTGQGSPFFDVTLFAFIVDFCRVRAPAPTPTYPTGG